MSLGDLANDLERIAERAPADLRVVVQRNIDQGNRAAQSIARGKSGPHGEAYYKRITAEMTGRLTGEWGPTGEVEGNAVGAGWRHGRNTDIPKSADRQVPKFVRDLDRAVDRWFW